MDYIELTVSLKPREPWTDILIAELAEIGFESFVETEEGVQAYAPESIGAFRKKLMKMDVLSDPRVEIEMEEKHIPYQNWNAQWEADFEPVLVDDRLAIIAPFHDQSAFEGKRKIIIQPQMSFGTGHHQTTYLMSQYMLDMQQMPERVLDMGTGTGVLAILAEQLGATHILAVDIEPWSVVNTVENAERNDCKFIIGLEGDSDVLPNEKFGLILANINKNILKAHLPTYAERAESGAILLLSGFFLSDADELIAAAAEVGFEIVETKEKETWASLKFKKN